MLVDEDPDHFLQVWSGMNTPMQMAKIPPLYMQASPKRLPLSDVWGSCFYPVGLEPGGSEAP